MTREQEKAIAIQDATYKVMSGEMNAENYWCYYVSEELFPSVGEFVQLVNNRAEMMVR